MDSTHHRMGTRYAVVPGAAQPSVILGDNDISNIFCLGQDSHQGWARVTKQVNLPILLSIPPLSKGTAF